MRARPLLVSLFAICSFVLQGAAPAWAAHPVAADASKTEAVQMAHCHGDAAVQEPAAADDCCCPDGQCACAAMCAPATALPASGAGLSGLIRAHFETARAVQKALSATPSDPLRPPISSAG